MEMAGFPAPVIRGAAHGRATAALIFLHGLGDTGDGWAPAASQMAAPHVSMVFPTAKTIPVTLNMGMPGPAWFDIKGLNFSADSIDGTQAQESVDYVHSLIAEQREKGIPAERIAVGGFSMGGNVAAKACLSYPEPLAGCIALSTWVEPGLSLSHRNMPFFVGHGAADPMIPAQFGKMTSKLLQDMGATDLTYREYPGMGHSACDQEFRDLKQFMEKILPEKQITEADIRQMSLRELKQFLTSRQINTRTLLEKSEFIDLALSLIKSKSDL